MGEQKGRTHRKTVCALPSHCTMGCYLKQLKSGKIKIDRAKIKAEELLDGKYLLTTSDDSLSAEDVALGIQTTAGTIAGKTNASLTEKGL